MSDLSGSVEKLLKVYGEGAQAQIVCTDEAHRAFEELREAWEKERKQEPQPDRVQIRRCEVLDLGEIKRHLLFTISHEGLRADGTCHNWARGCLLCKLLSVLDLISALNRHLKSAEGLQTTLSTLKKDVRELCEHFNDAEDRDMHFIPANAQCPAFVKVRATWFNELETKASALQERG